MILIGCDRVTTVASLWGRGALVGLFLLISNSTLMTSKAASEAAARMRAAGDQDLQDSAACGYSLAAANKQPATPVVAGARGYPRAASLPMDRDPTIAVIYTGESDSLSDSKPSAKSDRTVADSKTAAPRGSLDKELRYEMFGSSDDPASSSPGSN